MAEYLRALKPTLTQQQNDRVAAIVKQFISPSGLGPKLHDYLVEKRDAEDNWVIDIVICSYIRVHVCILKIHFNIWHN